MTLNTNKYINHKRNKMDTYPSPYLADIRMLLIPFLETAKNAKQFGNISFKKMKFDVSKLVDILQDELRELVKLHKPNVNMRDEMALIMTDMQTVIKEFNL